MNVDCLNELAEIVVNIDEGKNITDADIVSLTDRGIRLIAKMRILGLNVGSLQDIFAGMQLACGSRAPLPDLIDIAHDEIFNLLGGDAWRVYGYDEGWLIFSGEGSPEEVVTQLRFADCMDC